MNKCLMVITGAFHTGGGIAAVNRLVISALAEAGYKLDIYCLTEDDSTIDARYINPSDANYQVFGGDKLRYVPSVWQALLRNEYDLVFSDHVNVASTLAFPSKLRMCCYVVWLHGVEVFPPKPDFEGRIGLQAAWKGLASSEYTKQKTYEYFPRLPVTACDLALDPVRYPEESLGLREPSKSDLSMTAVNGSIQKLDRQMILNVGQMVSETRDKGQGCLLKAFHSVYELFTNAQLVLVGQGSDYSRLLILARSFPLQVQRQIFMPGYVDDKLLNRLYQACYVLAMPSIGEGFGLVYLEAMSRAKPCLGGNIDATPYLVRSGETGLLVDDPKSPEQVAEKIIWLLSHPIEAKEMGMAGYHLVNSQYLFSHFQTRFWQAIFS